MLDEPTAGDACPNFSNMHHIVRIDIRFNMRKKENYYLLYEEEDPIRATQSKIW